MGRGGSGRGNKAEGFQFTRNGKTYVVERTKSGVALVNGRPNTSVDYDALKRGASDSSTFSSLNQKQLKKIRNDRQKRKSRSADYELGAGVPWGNVENRRAARRQRMTARAQRRR